MGDSELFKTEYNSNIVLDSGLGIALNDFGICDRNGWELKPDSFVLMVI